MNEALFNLRFDELGQSSSQKYANKTRKKKTTKQNKKTINEIIEKERKIQKLIYTV